MLKLEQLRWSAGPGWSGNQSPASLLMLLALLVGAICVPLWASIFEPRDLYHFRSRLLRGPAACFARRGPPRAGLSALGAHKLQPAGQRVAPANLARPQLAGSRCFAAARSSARWSPDMQATVNNNH